MPRPKGSKNKKTLEKEGKLDEIEAKKLEEKNESKNQKEADKAFFDLVKRAKELDALVEEPIYHDIELPAGKVRIQENPEFDNHGQTNNS